MAEIIASTYELKEKIGAGGGGNVYLANHLRLNKKVVLKADKRKISSRPELLRREVDVLKNLNHTYIPKVYDFFVENDTVYTAMDYIDGISLDKLLNNGQTFPQAQVVEWAKQLLQALDYLHSPIHGDPPKGYVHSDIKPANIMLTSLGSVCLIDFNIALALGEENVIGCSAGYASPEHYGVDYSMGLGVTNTRAVSDDNATELITENGSTITSVRKVVPDIRSDIYSLGATLYHLLSGVRPAREAVDVIPLSDKKFSPQIVSVISKAMLPNPDLRYQSAAEMLYDLEHLHEHDPRYIRKKRSIKAVSVCLAVTFTVGLFSAFTGLKRIQSRESALKLAEYSKTALSEGKRDKASEYAMQALSKKTGLFVPAPTAELQAALTEALGVYDLSDSYRAYKTVELPSAPLYMRISPDGNTGACICSGELILFDTEKAEIINRFPAENSALARVDFISDSVIAYAADSGLKVYDINENKELWSGEKATAVCVSDNMLAALYKDSEYAIIYDRESGEVKTKIDFEGKKQAVAVNDIFADPRSSLFSLSRDGKYLAVSFEDGALTVFDTEKGSKYLEIFRENSGFTKFEGGFYGKYLAFAASNGDGSAVAVIDCKKKKQTGGFQSESAFSVKADESGIYVNQDNLLVSLDPESGAQQALAITKEDLGEFAVNGDFCTAAAKNKLMFFDKNGAECSSFDTDFTARFLALGDNKALAGFSDSPVVRIFDFLDNGDSTVLKYDSAYKHDEARISADKSTFMLFSNSGFAIYGVDGTMLTEQAIADSSAIYDQQYIRNGVISYFEITYYDGRVVRYDASAGTLLAEETAEVPDRDLYEEFYTDTLVIRSPLHGTPTAYNRKSGEIVRELETDAYLTYITQMNEYIIAQYIATDGHKFGVLMNDDCEKLAELPYLCDVYDEDLYFDYPSGKVSKTHIYGLDELISIVNSR